MDGGGDATSLPFEDASFEAVTVGFGIRNLADLEDGLRELARVEALTLVAPSVAAPGVGVETGAKAPQSGKI